MINFVSKGQGPCSCYLSSRNTEDNHYVNKIMHKKKVGVFFFFRFYIKPTSMQLYMIDVTLQVYLQVSLQATLRTVCNSDQ